MAGDPEHLSAVKFDQDHAILSHLWCIKSVLKSMNCHPKQRSYEDLYGSAALGLVRAGRQFQVGKGDFRFYAMAAIKNSVINAMNAMNFTVSPPGANIYKWFTATRHWLQEFRYRNHRSPSYDEFLDFTDDWPQECEYYKPMIYTRLFHSWETMNFDELSLTIRRDPGAAVPLLESGLVVDPQIGVQESEYLDIVLSAASRRPQYLEVLEMKHGVGRRSGQPELTFEQIGDLLGVSRQRAHNVYSKAVKYLRKVLAPKISADFQDYNYCEGD